MCWNTLLVSTGATATVFLLEEQQMRMKMEKNYVKLCPVPAMGSPCLHPTRNEGFWSGGFKQLGWKGKQTGPACTGGQILLSRDQNSKLYLSVKAVSLFFLLPVWLLLQLMSENTPLGANLTIHMLVLHFLGSMNPYCSSTELLFHQYPLR